MGELKPLPEHGSCFVCGTVNPHSIGIRWFVQSDNSIYGEVVLGLAQQGPPGAAHGGATAALLDEAMGAAAWQAEYRVAAVNLNIDYLQPVPLDQKISVTGTVSLAHENKVRTFGQIRLENGEVAVVGKGIYVKADHLFTDLLGDKGLIE